MSDVYDLILIYSRILCSVGRLTKSKQKSVETWAPRLFAMVSTTERSSF